MTINFWLGYIYHQLQTLIHRFWVCWYSLKVCIGIMYRAITHDMSKHSWKESKGFAQHIFELQETTYDSERYYEMMDDIKPSIDVHQNSNSHHPEYYDNKFDDMSFLDVMEMMLDWRAAVRRHDDGDLYESIEHNQDYGYEDGFKPFLYKFANYVGRGPDNNDNTQ